MNLSQQALEIFQDASFREAVVPEGRYQESVDRYGMRPMGYFHWVWLNAYASARYENSVREANAWDGSKSEVF